jgi:NADH:ubiquinone oxidoreductase subunit 2 (subunit N)
MPRVLVVNTGSSSIKYRLFAMPEGSGEPQGGAPVNREGSGEPQGGAPVDPVYDAIRERSSLEDYRGLARRHPWAAGLLAVFMLALTGIPPLSGFWAKYYVFLAGIQAGLTWLVVVAVISSVISAFFYLRVLVVAYLQEPAEVEARPGRTPALGLAIGLAGLLTVAIGLAPEALIAAARSAERILG